MNNRELCKELERLSGVKGYLLERALSHLGGVVHTTLGRGGWVVLGSVGAFKRGKYRPAKQYTVKTKQGVKTVITPAYRPVIFTVAGKYKKMPG